MKPLITLFLIALCFSGLCQSSIHGNFVSASKESTTTTYTAQWTIGEVINETFESSQVTASSGLSESNIILVVTGINPETSPEYEVRAYPNPFAKNLTVKSESVPLGEVTFDFFDALGKKLEVPVLLSEKNRIIFLTENLSAGLYFLSVTNHQNIIIRHIKLTRE